jgi:predicted nucleic acid-binding protein
MAKRRNKPRVKVDANILFSGVIWRRWPYEVLRHAARGDFRLVLCQQVIDEATERLADYFPQQPRRLQRFLSTLAFDLQLDPSLKQVTRNKSLLPDPDDVAIALAAINAKVDFFVSEDKHFTIANESSAQFHQKVRVMISGTFLREVMGWSGDRLDQVKKRM